jgi:hypothetical protein
MLTQLTHFYDRIFRLNPERRVEKITLYFAILGFILHLLYIFSINNFEQLSYLSSGKSESYLAAIYTPFSILLFYEVFLLVIIIPNSTSAFVGKQFEIISLITLRSFFHDIAEVDPFAQIEYNNPLFLKIGLDLLSNAYSNNLTLSVQPKYMGSRCNVYLDCVNLDMSYSVSRNGYLIKQEQVDMSCIYKKLWLKLKTWLTNNNVKMIILDGELVPWSVLGSGLIHNEFMPVKAGLESEIEFAEKYNFDTHYNQMIENLNKIVEEKDFSSMSKKHMIEKIPNHYKTYQAYLSEKPYHQDTNLLKSLFTTYSKQMDLYGNIHGYTHENTYIDYKPFGIIKIIYNDNTESIPLLDGSIGQSQMYGMLCSELETDSQLIVQIKPDSDMEQVHLQIKNWFDKKTIQEGFEGIILKPDIILKDKIPMIKVRNQDYLTIIYGYDYKLDVNYKNLVEKKTTRHKIAQSIKEFKLGLNLLTMNYSYLNSDEYKSRLENFIKCELDGNNLDPRL